MCIGHAEDEQPPDGGEDYDGFEPEEGAQLVGSESAEGEVDEPEEEECQHALRGDADGGGDVVGDVGEGVPKDAAEDVRHKGCAGVYCFSLQYSVFISRRP